MDCPSCGHGNRETARFCGECTAPLAREMECPECGTANPAGQKFCDNCTHPLAAEGAAPARDPLSYTPKHLADKILQSKSALEGERKQVTVLFADVKGSMELAEQLDPEEWHGILERFFEILSEGVHRFEGTVNQYTGDGIMALFGAPIAHEDHAQRACYAALQLRKELRAYADELRRTKGLSLSTRIGINSGEVVVGKIGDDLRMDYTAQGHTVGLAQRMEQRAAADSAYLTAETASLVEGFFDLRDLGDFEISGAREPVRVFELEGLGAARTRLDQSRARGFAKFVGRDREMASLESALEQAISGNGQVVGVVADAGTGKSRLCAEFVEGCRARGIRVNEAHCPAHGKNIPFLPLLQMLRDIFEIEDRDTDHDARRKIAGELMLLDEKFHGMLPLLFDFLGVADPSKPPLAMSPEARQQQLFAFVRELPKARSQREVSVLLLDDLHWIDPGSDEFLAHSVDAAPGTRTFWLVNFRPEYSADWMSKSYYQQMSLRPLGRDAIDELLLDLIGSDPSLDAVPDLIYERTGGNPFFVEEVVQSLVENGSLEGTRGSYRLAAPVEALEIPGTVQSVLAARIDRLPEREKRLLQTASVIEKEFAEPILREVAELPDRDLAASLAALVQAEFLLEKALYPVAEYAFKHPLTQEVSYNSLLGERRTKLHGAVAVAIEAAHADRLDERAALLAYHWENTEEVRVAATWHARAARHAGVDSQAEALRHWDKVWEMLAEEPETTDSVALRLEAASALLRIGFRSGISPERAEQVFVPGRRLAEVNGDARSLVGLLYGFGVGAFMLNGTPRKALPFFLEAIEVADSSGDAELRWAAREPTVGTHCYLGNLDEALRFSDELMEICGDDPMMRVDVISFTAAWGYATRGWLLADLGRFDEAARAHDRCDEAARRAGDMEEVSFNEAFRARSLARAGDADAALAAGARAVLIAEEIQSQLALVNAYAHHGMALVLGGQWAAARDRLLQALEIARAEHIWLTLEGDFLALLAAAYLGAGDAEQARVTAEEAVRVAQRTETPIFESHAQLLLARALTVLSGSEDARGDISAALDRADALLRETGARSCEPEVLEGRARLADAAGDPASAEQLRRDAQRLYTDMGATGHAERMTRELAALSS